jgi:hypothetical protein
MATQGRKAISETDRRAIRSRLEAAFEGKHGAPLNGGKYIHGQYGVGPKTMKNWLRSKSPVTPDVSQWMRIAEVTGESLDWLLRGKRTLPIAPPVPATPPTSAAEQLYDEVCNRLELERGRKVGRHPSKVLRELHAQNIQRTEAELIVVRRMGPDVLWEEVISTVPEIGELGMEVSDVEDELGLTE